MDQQQNITNMTLADIADSDGVGVHLEGGGLVPEQQPEDEYYEYSREEVGYVFLAEHRPDAFFLLYYSIHVYKFYS